jgi:capsule biosynthesis phosphatase
MRIVVLCGIEPIESEGFPSPLTLIHGYPAIWYVLQNIDCNEITFVVSQHLERYNFSGTTKFLFRQYTCHFVQTISSTLTEMALECVRHIDTTDSVLFVDARFISECIPLNISCRVFQRGMWGFPSVFDFLECTKESRLESLTPNVEHVAYSVRTNEEALEAGKHVKPHTLRICFDLDNTLVTPPSIPRDYTTVEPIPHMIALVQRLKREGHTIIIHTARKMLTHGHNLGAAMASVGKLTFETLDRFDIPYDELLFGKPYADLYIDDKAYNQYTTPLSVIGFPDL